MNTCERWLACGAMLCVLGCGDDDEPAPNGDAGGNGEPDAAVDASSPDATTAPDYTSEAYAMDDNWLCRPGAENGRCEPFGPSTAVAEDGSLTEIDAPSELEAELDCFYVYPTIDLTEETGRVEDFSNIDDIWASAQQHIQIFSHLCDVYAPLYHQVQIGTYLDNDNRDDLLEDVYDEVEDAFLHYMAHHNDGRDIVFIGHSQGSHMLRRLLQRHFDGDDQEASRDQLALAVLIGTLGDITVPEGELVGGTFDNIPVCSGDSERGCVLTYSSYTQDAPPNAAFGLFVGGIPEGHDAPCINPVAVGDERETSSGARFMSTPGGVATGTTIDARDELDVETDFVVYPDLYGLQCAQSDAGHSYLEVTIVQDEGAEREDPILYDSEELSLNLIGLHILDFHLAAADLTRRIAEHAQ